MSFNPLTDLLDHDIWAKNSFYSYYSRKIIPILYKDTMNKASLLSAVNFAANFILAKSTNTTLSDTIKDMEIFIFLNTTLSQTEDNQTFYWNILEKYIKEIFKYTSDWENFQSNMKEFEMFMVKIPIMFKEIHSSQKWEDIKKVLSMIAEISWTMVKSNQPDSLKKFEVLKNTIYSFLESKKYINTAALIVSSPVEMKKADSATTFTNKGWMTEIINYYNEKHQLNENYNDIFTVYFDTDFSLILIGSYSLPLIKEEQSLIDLVLLSNNPEMINNIQLSQIFRKIEKWIGQKNTTHTQFYLEKNEESQLKSPWYYTWKRKKFNVKLKDKDVNIYWFNNKFGICNDFFRRIFRENSPLWYLHAFYYAIFLMFQFYGGSEVCFFIVSFLDYRYNIFNLNKQMTQKSNVLRRSKKCFEEEKIYYYELVSSRIKELESKNKFELFQEFNEYTKDMIHDKIKVPDRFNDKSYWFNIKFFYKVKKDNAGVYYFTNVDKLFSSDKCNNYMQFILNK